MFNRTNTLAVCLFLIALFVTGCDSSVLTPASSTVPATHTGKHNADPSVGNGPDIQLIPSFDLRLTVAGSLKPNHPIQLKARIVGKRDVQDAEVKIMLPELAALRASEQRWGSRETLEWPIGQPIASEARTPRRVGNGQSITEQVTVNIPEPGYYRAVAMVSDLSNDLSENGRWIDPADGEEIWLWIDEDGGTVTERFDVNLFPDGVRTQPGPFVAKDEAPRWVPVRNGKAGLGVSSKSGGATLVVTYFDPVDGVNKPLKDARVDVNIYDGYEDRVVSGVTLSTDENGETPVECKQNDPIYEVQISVFAENSDVIVHDQADSKQVSYLEDPTCGATVTADAYSST